MNHTRWPDGIAVIGMSGRFPKARTIDEFWSNLVGGVECVERLGDDDLLAAGIDASQFAAQDYVKVGMRLEDVDKFDAQFFGYSQRDAEILDPQQRLFLECAWHALEDAGYGAVSPSRPVGVFASTDVPSYFLSNILRNAEVAGSAGPYAVMLASDKDYLAVRVAFKLDLRGPALSVQTACSSSLVAVHLACQSLFAGECEMALAGGSSILFPHPCGYKYTPGMILSPDGHCRPFDVRARGTIFSPGVGAVVLKRLSKALADGDSVHAVIRGTALNNDGAAKAGFTAPSVDGQINVIGRALEIAGFDARSIGFIETHGTGTELGDPIEVAALTETFRRHTDARGFCALGSVKANIGHTSNAAGIVGLVKTVLAVREGVIPPAINFEQPNPQLELEKSPFLVNTSPIDWPVDGLRRAGVSSFGIGGTNAHACLEQSPAMRDEPSARPSQLLVLSARSVAALETTSRQLAECLETKRPSLADASYTLQVGREPFAFRRALVCSDAQSAAAALRASFRAKRPERRSADIVFLFPGQGEQYPGMGRELYDADPQFRATVDAGCEILSGPLGRDFRKAFLGEGVAAGALDETHLTQPALFLIEYAMAKRWLSLGVRPAALIGHSIGELAAAAIAGVFSFEQGLEAAVARGRAMQEAPVGAMLGVSSPAEAVREWLDGDAAIACYNAPALTVLAGTVEGIERAFEQLRARGLTAIRLPSNRAFHSPSMHEPAARFTEALRRLSLGEPQIPWVSTATGKWITPEESSNPEFWGNQIREPVRFVEAVRTLAPGSRMFVEVGPGNTLRSLVRRQAPDAAGVASLPGRQRSKKSAYSVWLEAIGELWSSGVPIDWPQLSAPEERRRVGLPGYPFERTRHWVSPAAAAPGSAAAAVPKADAFERKKAMADWFYAPSWRRATDTPAGQPADSGSWLVVADSGGFAERVAKELRARGRTVIVADRLPDEAARISHVAFFGAMRRSPGMPFDAFVRLMQSLVNRGIRLAQVAVVTDALESVTGDDRVEEPERALLHGTCVVLAREYPETLFRTIDVPDLAPFGDPGVDRLAGSIAADLAAARSGDRSAYRGGYRWTLEWNSVPVPETVQTPLRKSGVYLITGGLGGVGFSLAEYLAREFQAKLILTGRTDPAAENARLARSRLQALQASGAEVRYYRAEASDRAAMRSVMDRAAAEFGRIDGIIHAAGAPDGVMFAEISLETAWATIRAKFDGAFAIADAARGHSPEFIALCSSLSTILAVIGQTAYAAANSFLDAFAHWHQAHTGIKTLALNYDAWREVGMLSDENVPESLREIVHERLRTALTPAEGVEVFRRALAWPHPQIAVSTRDLNALQSLVSETANRVASSSLGPRDAGRKRPEGEAHDVLEHVIAVWKELLATENVEPDSDFFALGGHSLLGTMVLSRIHKHTGVLLPLRAVFEYSTPTAMAEVIRAMTPAETGAGTSRQAEANDEIEEFVI